MKTKEEIIHEKYMEEYEKTRPGERYPQMPDGWVNKAMEEYANQFKQKWIPVSERLPDQFEYVDIWVESHNRLTEFYFDGEIFEGDLFGESEYFEPLKHITHWMPLPPKPE